MQCLGHFVTFAGGSASSSFFSMSTTHILQRGTLFT
jgi:hypothetical protein